MTPREQVAVNAGITVVRQMAMADAVVIVAQIQSTNSTPTCPSSRHMVRH